MGYGYQRLAILALAVTSASLMAFAQAPPPPPPGGHPPMPKPQNLKVLPKDISISDLITIMKGYKTQLGVECGYCHVVDPATHQINFASDDNKEKVAARIMMTMTSDINAKYVSTIPDYMGGKVSCGTCHRGHAMPEEFAPAGETPAKP